MSISTDQPHKPGMGFNAHLTTPVEKRRRDWTIGVAVLALLGGIGAFLFIILSASPEHHPAAPQPSAAPTTPASVPVAALPTPIPATTLAAGYPKVVTFSSVPDNFRANLPQDGEEFALLLAPNVYTAFPAGGDVDAAVSSGGLVGLCVSVQSYVTAHPDQVHGFRCF